MLRRRGLSARERRGAGPRVRRSCAGTHQRWRGVRAGGVQFDELAVCSTGTATGSGVARRCPAGVLRWHVRTCANSPPRWRVASPSRRPASVAGNGTLASRPTWERGAAHALRLRGPWQRTHTPTCAAGLWSVACGDWRRRCCAQLLVYAQRESARHLGRLGCGRPAGVAARSRAFLHRALPARRRACRGLPRPRARAWQPADALHACRHACTCALPIQAARAASRRAMRTPAAAAGGSVSADKLNVDTLRSTNAGP